MHSEKKRRTTNSDPLFIIISDLHFSHININQSAYALTCALLKAEELRVPLIIAGDLNDTKAIIRAEVANELIRILKNSKCKIYLLVGNHDLINEKGKEHGLHYLQDYVEIVDSPKRIYLYGQDITFIPYQSTPDDFIKIVKETCHPGDLLVMHQGIREAFMGDYILDKSAVSTDVVAKFTCFSGHYHRHQTIGTVTYVGNPFTMSFGEANDPPKGFLVVYKDGHFSQETLNLRKHVVLEVDATCLIKLTDNFSKDDFIWIKLKGSASDLENVTRAELKVILGFENFKFDKICIQNNTNIHMVDQISGEEILDKLIDNLKDSVQKKKQLKVLWRGALAA